MSVTPIIHVSEIEPALAFYRDTLDFDTAWAVPEEDTGKLMHAELGFEGATLMIGLLPGDHGPSGRLGEGLELYFRTNRDLDGYFERLRAAGVQVVAEPADQFWGDRTFSIHDPFGYWLTFASISLPGAKEALLAGMAEARSALERTLNGLSEEQLTGPRDAGGWSVKDHVAHLTAWERSMIFLFQGRPRHEGLGVEESLYHAGDIDAINAAIWEQHMGRPLPDILDQFEATHRQMLEVLDGLSYDDLLKPYSAYLPDEPGEETGEPIVTRLLGNTTSHFALHRGWIQKLAG